MTVSRGQNVADTSDLKPMLANYFIRFLHTATIIIISKHRVREIGTESICMPWAKGKAKQQCRVAEWQSTTQTIDLLNQEA